MPLEEEEEVVVRVEEGAVVVQKAAEGGQGGGGGGGPLDLEMKFRDFISENAYVHLGRGVWLYRAKVGITS